MADRAEKIALLRTVPLFEHCSEGELEAVAELATEVSVPAGGKLTVEGDWGREFFVLLDGAADVERHDKVVNQLGPGDFLGEITLIHGRRRTATATATVPTHLLVIASSDFRQLMREDPSIETKINEAVEARLANDEADGE